MTPISKFSVAAIVATVLSAGAPAAAATLTPAQSREDVQLAIDAVEAALPDLYWSQSPEAWRQARAEALSKAATVERPMDLFRILRPLMSQIGEGHLTLFPSPEMVREERETVAVLPLDLHWSDDGAFVIAGYGQAADIPSGARLLAINEESASALTPELMAALGHDGAIPTGAMREAGGRRYAIVRHRLRGDEASFRIRFETADGAIAERTVAAAPLSSLPKTSPKPEPSVASLEWVDGDIAYLNVPTFRNETYEEAGTTFRQAMQGLFEELHRRGATRLILDLRENGGGDEPNESILFSYLVKAPLHKYEAVDARARRVSVTSLTGRRYETEIYDDAEMAFQRPIHDGRLTRKNIPPDGLMSHWAPSSPVFEGRLVVLAGGYTFSGGAELASMLRHVRRGVFVGEEVGGGDKGNTSGYRWRITLPNSGLRLSAPLLQFRMNWPGEHGDRGVQPDCPIPPRVDEIGQRRDRAWRVASTVVRQDWKTPGRVVCPKVQP